MADERKRKATDHNEANDFDPTQPESGSLVPKDSSDGAMTVHLASNEEIRKAITDLFKDLSDQARGLIFEESVQINQSTQRVVFEQMRIGAAIHSVLRTVISGLHLSYPASENSIAMAEKRCYSFFKITQGMSKNLCQLYLRKYERFNDNPDAIEHLTATDMRTLLTNNRSDDLVNVVIEHRKENKDATQKDIDKLIADYEARLRRAQDTIDSKNAEIGVLCERNEVAEQMQRDAIDDRNKVDRDMASLQSEMEDLRRSRDALHLEVRRSSDKYNALLREQAEATARFTDLSAKYRDATANPETIETFVDKIPEGYTTLKEATEDAARKLEETASELAAGKEALKRAREQLAQTNEELRGAAMVRDQFERMLFKFTEFSAEFSASKLVANMTGHFPGQRDVVRSLVEQLTKYTSELQSALGDDESLSIG